MDQTPKSAPIEPKPATPPVMDIVPPRAVPDPVRQAPKEDESVDLAAAKDADKGTDQAKPKPQASKSPAKTGNGLGLVVAASVIIILGLGAMLTYAYLRTQGISLF